ncbi:unnamed protein product [Ostreobium quekettii]|uniref:Uncharacterized protein n=1 Tax=Ostreobium quekettii TaxID=121088 RepID=A0A8S1JAB6_9CHLO|nr:unnamed protein product [Ostreobium quekettii]
MLRCDGTGRAPSDTRCVSAGGGPSDWATVGRLLAARRTANIAEEAIRQLMKSCAAQCWTTLTGEPQLLEKQESGLQGQLGLAIKLLDNILIVQCVFAYDMIVCIHQHIYMYRKAYDTPCAFALT